MTPEMRESTFALRRLSHDGADRLSRSQERVPPAEGLSLEQAASNAQHERGVGLHRWPPRDDEVGGQQSHHRDEDGQTDQREDERDAAPNCHRHASLKSVSSKYSAGLSFEPSAVSHHARDWELGTGSGHLSVPSCRGFENPSSQFLVPSP